MIECSNFISHCLLTALVCHAMCGKLQMTNDNFQFWQTLELAVWSLPAGRQVCHLPGQFRPGL